jgi:hypothetical protein
LTQSSQEWITPIRLSLKMLTAEAKEWKQDEKVEEFDAIV